MEGSEDSELSEIPGSEDDGKMPEMVRPHLKLLVVLNYRWNA